MKIRAVTGIRNGHYLENGAVDCEVLFEGETEYVPYTAMQDDMAPTGQYIWQALQSGKWGEIAPFVVTEEMCEAARMVKRREIEAWRNVQENAGYTFKFNGHTWDYGKASQARLQPVSLVARSGQLPADFFWTDAHNHDIPMTAEDVLALESAMVGAMVAKGFEIHRHQRELKDALEKLTNLEDIRAFKVE